MPSRESPAATICDYCGFLDWTVKHYGRITHKQGCPHRIDPWHQGDPTAERPAANVQHEVATVMKALAPMGGTKEQSDACIALGRLAAWAEAGLTPRFAIQRNMRKRCYCWASKVCAYCSGMVKR